MRFWILTAVILAVAGCSGDPPPSAGTATTTATATATAEASPPGPSPAGAPFLAEVRGGMLLGDYTDGDLLTLGAAICDSLAQGGDATAGGTPTGEGTLTYPEVSVPVWAVDVLAVELAARHYLCPGR